MKTAEQHRDMLLPVLDAFAIEGQFERLDQWTDGHINQTYRATMNQQGTIRRYVIQRVNAHVFKNIDALMDNSIRVSEHASRKLAMIPDVSTDTLERGAIRFLRTRAGGPGHPDTSGDVWRAYPCIERSKAHLVATCPDEAYEAAKAFGLFQGLLSDLPGARLQETLPGFHDTPRRFSHLEDAVRSDPRARVAAVHDELHIATTRRAKVSVLQDAFAAGVFPERVVHNDAKLSNVLLDTTTNQSVAVIDLDTVMPGYALHDFGDLVRSICNPATEGETDLSKVEVRFPYFEALVTGYLESAGAMLTPGEIELLPDAGWAMTFEVGLRFLTDYLNGDLYFRIQSPDDNLVRARTQLTLARRIEEALPELRAIVRRKATATR